MNFRLNKTIEFVYELGTIMYVGGILSHIVMGIIFKDASVHTTFDIALYKNESANYLIIPGLIIKLLVDAVMLLSGKKIPDWFKLKLICTIFLAINAFFFLVPMMKELVELSNESIKIGRISASFLELEHREQFFGKLNAVPLLLELMLHSFKPIIRK